MKLKVNQTLLFLVLMILMIAGTAIGLTREVDAIRVLYKRYKAQDIYQFEEIRPEHKQIDPAGFISLSEGRRPRIVRESILRLLKEQAGNGYKLVREIDLVGASKARLWFPIRDEFSQWDGVKSFTRFRYVLEPEVHSYVYHLVPEKPVGKGVVYHHGFGEPFTIARPLFEALLLAGYDVMIYNHFGFGENYLLMEVPGCGDSGGETTCGRNMISEMEDIPRALHYQLSPIFDGLDYLEYEVGVKTIDIVGFSAGAPTATVVAALSDKVRNVVAVAGVYPDYLREGQEVAMGIAAYPPLRDKLSMMDLFVMTAIPKGRQSVQLFNRFDRCCFRNRKGLLYVESVRKAVERIGGQGQFDVIIDESHADHKISISAINTILDLVQ
ncbi:alpha/beta fold hydrolase [Aestuariispira insulae]|uniref:Alpha/beta hydrolase family protein n=1 Tax=Aestuariispira insulae TaxID=1461337 RepID=A0A3D9H2M1_9PROT|nr:alpha/beta fold hydrolase [Aestuariispira insulae]RED43749.1 alpha/beta hydrolase family protein [Aestuariispira insulae]